MEGQPLKGGGEVGKEGCAVRGRHQARNGRMPVGRPVVEELRDL